MLAKSLKIRQCAPFFEPRIVVMDIKSAVSLGVIHSLSLLSLPVARVLGSGLGRFLAFSNSKMYQVSLKNIELCIS